MIFLLWIFVVYWVEARRFRCIYLSLSHRALRTNGVLKLLLVSGWVGPPSEVFILKTSLIRWSIGPFGVGHTSRRPSDPLCGFHHWTRVLSHLLSGAFFPLIRFYSWQLVAGPLRCIYHSRLFLLCDGKLD